MNAPHKVRDYHLTYPDKPGPPVRLEAWLKAYENDEDLEKTEEDCQAVSKPEDQSKRRVTRRK